MTEEENEIGLYSKYLIFKQSEGKWTGKETKSFVLSPEKLDEYGAASRIAIISYYDAIKGTNPKLAIDLKKWIDSIEAD